MKREGWHKLVVGGHTVRVETMGDAMYLHLDCVSDTDPNESAVLRLDWYYDEPTFYIWDKGQMEDAITIGLGRVVTNPTA